MQLNANETPLVLGRKCKINYIPQKKVNIRSMNRKLGEVSFNKSEIKIIGVGSGGGVSSIKHSISQLVQ